MPLPDWNRRKEVRYRKDTGRRISWHADAGRRSRRKAWMLDTSANGLGVLVEKPKMPKRGERIVVRTAGDFEPRVYEVRRVAVLPGKLAVVGCERVYGTLNTPHHPVPPKETRRVQDYHDLDAMEEVSANGGVQLIRMHRDRRRERQAWG